MPALTTDERNLVHAAYMLGQSVFVEKGMTTQEYLAFLNRPEVEHELRVLAEEQKDGQAMERRRQFMARRYLASNIPEALRVLRDAIRGPRYMRTSSGKPIIGSAGKFLIERPAPTSSQIEAAKDLLDRLNITGQDARKGINIFAAMALKFNYGLDAEEGVKLVHKEGATEAQQRHSRERMRAAIRKFAPDLDSILPKLQSIVETSMKSTSDSANTGLVEQAPRSIKKRMAIREEAAKSTKKKKKKRP